MTDYHDYIIALSPSENMVDQLKRFKYFSYEKIGEFEGYDTKPDIIVQKWTGKKPQMVESLLPKLEIDLQNLPPVVLEIDGFELVDLHGQPGICAKIKNTVAGSFWFNELGGLLNAKQSPYLPIATHLSADTVTELWPSFKHTSWNARMVIDKLSILRRPTIGYNKNFKLFKQISLNTNLNFYDFANTQLSSPVSALNKNTLLQVSMF